MKIYLSPSTQERNIGAGSYGTEEKRMNELTDIIEPLLKTYGYEVFRNHPSMTLEKVVINSNDKRPDIHVAIHSNAFNKTVRGCEIFYHTKGEKLARSIYKYLEPLTPTADRGVKQNSNYYETAYTTAASIIIEVDFHDNIDSANWILNNLKPIALAIVNGINDYAGVNAATTIDYKLKYETLVKELEQLYLKYGGK